MKRYIITGGCGFVGRNVIAKLLEGGSKPSDIKVIDDLSVGTREDLAVVSPDIEIIEMDVRDVKGMEEHLKDADAVIHLAGSTGVVPALKDPLNDCTSNVVGTLNVLEAARKNGINRIVYASSGAPLGNATPPIHEEKLRNPISPYGASKMACEGYCMAYANCFGMETVILRFGNLYGPYSERKISIVASFINNALAGKPLEVHGDGNSTRDYIYAPDLAEAVIKGATVPNLKGEIFQIASEKEMSVNEITEMMLELFKKHDIKGVQVERVAPRDSDIARSFAVTDKAKNMLGWQAGHTLEEGLEKTLLFFRKAK